MVYNLEIQVLISEILISTKFTPTKIVRLCDVCS